MTSKAKTAGLFTKSCKCGGIIFGPRLGGKARGQWLGYDECHDCRTTSAGEAETPPPSDPSLSQGDVA